MGISKIYSVAISGSTGFIGRKLAAWLSGKNYEVIPITRRDFEKGASGIAEKIAGCEALVNLAGAPVITRWTTKARKEIMDSRISTTGILVEALRIMNEKPVVFINASAIGIYDQDNIHSEESKNYDNGFLAHVVREWERTAGAAEKFISRLIFLRIGIVLSFQGGAAAKVKSLFRFGLGGFLGTGKQKMSFIHIDDLCRMVEFILLNKSVEGIVNCVAPEATSNREYSRELARIFGWKHLAPVPSFILRLRFGKAADILLKGQHVIPEGIMKAGFVFDFPDIVRAVKSLKDETK